MLTRVRKLLMVLTMLSFISGLWADSESDLPRFLEARDNSITSYDITMRQAHFNIELDDYEAFRRSVKGIEGRTTGDMDPLQVAEELVHRWGKEIAWCERQMLKRNERFKEVVSSLDGRFTNTDAYDGELYRSYSKHNGQLDIYPDIPPVAHASLDRLGLVTRGIREQNRLISVEEHEQGPRCTFSPPKDDSCVLTMQYDREFNLRQLCNLLDGETTAEDMYLFHREADGYSVPQLRININVFKDRCSVYCWVVEDTRINCRLSDEDLSIGEMPLWTLVMDRRHVPPVQRQLIDYPHEILTDERMLGGLGEFALPAEDVSDNSVVVPEQEATPGAPSDGEQASPDDLDSREDSGTMASSSGHEWLGIMAVCIVAGGCAVVLRRQSKSRRSYGQPLRDQE